MKYRKSKWTMDLVYPNKSYGGVYSLGLLIIANIVNSREDWFCKRVFSDSEKVSSKLVGFSLQYELDLKKAISMKGEGLNFAGGPLVSMNPEMIGEHFDFLLIGDVEEVIVKVLKEYEKGEDQFLKRISKIKGVYVPGKNKVSSAFVKDLDKVPYPIVQEYPEKIDKDFVFGKCLILEIERGCPFECKFCPLNEFYQGYRYRSFENIKKIIDEGLEKNNVEKVVIYSPSFAHPKRKEILKYLLEKKVRVTVPSLRAELIDKECLELIKKCGQESVTIAPESAERLRFSLNKKVKDEAYFNFIKMANEVGFKKLKVYMMIGLPNTSEKDLEEFIEFVDKVKAKFKGQTYLSINYLVPKPKTKFSEHVFDKKILKQEAKYLKKELKKIKVKLSSLSTAYKEWEIIHGHLN
ncbi:MAG: radical SAM protein [Nanoarchaeota archaeon]|nr:radical SAM protein [Nanoarchaeota archaeon]